MSRLKSFTTIKADKEADDLSAAEASQSNHAAAAEAVSQAEDQSLAAEDLVAAIEASALRGENTYSAQDYAAALSARTWAEIVLTGAQRLLVTTTKALRSTHSEIAHVGARLVEKAMPGVVTIPTFATITDVPRDDERPCVLVRQMGQTERMTNGYVAGAVELTYYRTSVHVPLDANALKDAAHNMGVSGAPKGFVNSNDALGVDRLRFTVHAAAPETPVIAKINPNQAGGLARILATDLADSCRDYGTNLKGDHVTGLVESTKLVVVPFGTIVESEEWASGRRQLTLVTSLAAKAKVELVAPTLSELVDALVKDYRGAFVPGLGVVESLESVPTDEATSNAAVEAVRKATDMPTNVALIGFEGIRCFTLRAILGSATGSVTLAGSAA
jgi:hypothetical protein